MTLFSLGNNLMIRQCFIPPPLLTKNFLIKPTINSNMDNFKDEIIKLLKKELKDTDIILEIPPKPELGDYAFPCFPLAKIYKKNPAEIAKELASKIGKSKLISEI